MEQLEKWVVIVNELLRVAFFGMMGLGLLLASVFLYLDKIDGGQWVAMCGILFGADRLGSALTYLGKRQPTKP